MQRQHPTSWSSVRLPVTAEGRQRPLTLERATRRSAVRPAAPAGVAE